MHIKQTTYIYVNNSHQKNNTIKFFTDRIIQTESTHNRIYTNLHEVLANKTKGEYITKWQGWVSCVRHKADSPKLMLFLADFTGAEVGLPSAHLQTHE